MLFETALAGEWEFALDSESVGEREKWFDGTLPETIALPGSVDEAAKTPLTTEKTMFFLSRKHPYVGKAWYARDFEVPENAHGLFHHLFLERVHGELNVWVDGYKLGRDDSLSTPNRLLIGQLSAGKHRLVMMIDNARYEAVGEAVIRENSMMSDVAHSQSDHTQTNWNGVVGRMAIEAARASIARLDIDARSHEAQVKIELEAYDPSLRWPTYWTEEHTDELVLSFDFGDDAQPLEIRHPFRLDSAFLEAEIEVALPEDARRWDEFDPVVHRLAVTWLRDGIEQDRHATSFGIRSFERDGRRLLLNGRPVFLRGTLDCAIFPLTGYPPTDHQGWRKVFGAVKAYGLNHVRYHSWCPPEAAFDVADEMGILLHVETPVWPVLGADPNLDRYIHAEAERIIKAYGNHPSFVMFCVGNEVHGDGLHAFLERFIGEWKARDKRRAYTGGSGWPTTQRADYASKPEARSQRWQEGLEARLNARPLETRTDWRNYVEAETLPLLSHEIGQWCVFPNLDEIDKYTGVTEARSFELVRDDLDKKGLLHLWHDYFINNGKLQTQLYKEDIEAALRTRDFLGTQLLGLQDFTGQGTALVGVVDAFWDPKPYVSAEEFSEFCSPVVPLVRASKFVVEQGAGFEADVQIAQFGPKHLHDARIRWQLLGAHGCAAEGTIEVGNLPTGHLHDVGSISIDTSNLPAAERYELVISLDGTEYRNRWGVWVLPADEAPAPPKIVHELDDQVLALVEDGETVVFQPRPEAMKPNASLGHTAAFWNTLWTQGQEPHTMGLLNDSDHPAFAGFPIDRHSDWHLWELTFHRRALDVAGFDVGALMRVIDDWNANRDLVLLAEVALGKGRLILSAIDLTTDLNQRPVARCLRASLARYAASSKKPLAPSARAEGIKSWWRKVAA
ncbi:beta-galactosidase [Devosia pacifica]|uniref:Beta-galactosidase n=1 Tax=Devosia pacifica TaxID=1335967 RepID=A0A918VRC6_9HYPH|nr:sugar-binding domain-containing protein [Devosia pacifica]GHA21866.1 beta-galactosidase [Devosia pacifica]